MIRFSQNERILVLLRTREWVGLPEILDLRIANYRARVSDLRERGYVILNRKEEAADGTVHSWYRLAGEPEPIRVGPSGQGGREASLTLRRGQNTAEPRTGQKELFS